MEQHQRDQPAGVGQKEFDRRKAEFDGSQSSVELRLPKLRELPWWVSACGRGLYLSGLILGALLGVALIVPRLFNRTCDSCIAATRSDLMTISSALENFRFDNGRYPSTAEGLAAIMEPPKGLEKTWKGPYLTKPVPKDEWGNTLIYQREPRDSFRLESYGQTGRPGGEGGDAPLVVEPN